MAGNEVVMTERKTDLKTRYEFLIAGLLVLVLGNVLHNVVVYIQLHILGNLLLHILYQDI